MNDETERKTKRVSKQSKIEILGSTSHFCQYYNNNLFVD